MATPRQEERRARIEDAAYDALAELGYRGASLLAIAKRAKASNETLYRWYGNKQELFASLATRNVQDVRTAVFTAIAETSDPLQVLRRIGGPILRVATGERAVALNRAAAADVSDTGTLGGAIASNGREALEAIVGDLVERAMVAGSLRRDDVALATEVYAGLLVGDHQVRRVIGVVPELTDEECAVRADRAVDLLERAFAPGHAPIGD